VTTLGIIGVGLIGGSVALGVRLHDLFDEIVGFDVATDALDLLVADGLLDRSAESIESLARASTLVLISVPTRSIGVCLAALARSGRSHELAMTDTGSVKGTVVSAALEAFGELPSGFVPGHPIAGSEHSGAAWSDPDLFKDRKVILTPTTSTSPDALARVEALWQGLGARVEHLSAERHDRLLAMTSHLPHLLAYALVDTLASQPAPDEIFDLAAGGFRDFTRIASSDPQMWHDIFMDNSEGLIDALDLFEGHLRKLRTLVEELRSEDILALCERAKQTRDRHLNRG
jgi:prephenate dehydrogenase